MKCPSPETEAEKLGPLLSNAFESTLTRDVTPVLRLRTKMSEAWLVSPETSCNAPLENATNCPSAAEIEGEKLSAFACPPPVDRLTRSVVPLERSRTKMSENELVSPATRLVA